MVPTWSFQSAGRIVFGPGCARRSGELLAQLGWRRCLLVTDPNLSASAEAVRRSAEAHGVACSVFDGGVAEPSLAAVDGLMARISGQRFDAVIGVGGGSNIDLAKAAALLLRHGGALRDYAGQCRLPGPALPIVAVPTTAGSGSEVSGACLIGEPEGDTKLAVVDNGLRPALAVVDPELQLGCPPAVTRDAGIDAFCHAVEALTIVEFADFPREATLPWPVYQGKHPFTDMLAEEAVGLIARSLPRVLREPRDLAARGQMALGALLAGMAMASTGLYTVHALTYPVGAFSGASHGACNGVLLPAVLDFVAPLREAETRRLRELLGSTRARVGDAVRDFLRSLGAPVWLEELGFERDRIEPAAEIAHGIRRLMQGSPRPTSRAELAGILRAACEGGA
jgi:alcohol dehydrogenase class IV